MKGIQTTNGLLVTGDALIILYEGEVLLIKCTFANSSRAYKHPGKYVMSKQLNGVRVRVALE